MRNRIVKKFSFTLHFNSMILRSLCFLILASIFIFPSAAFSQSDDDLLYRKVRVTLVPGLSTNGVEAPRYSAKYSLNLIAGYHGGLEGYEIGPVNINREFARGLQIGALNLTGGDMQGIQFASLANISGDELQGVQFSGLANISGGEMQGLQFSGLANVSRYEIQGLQFSGIINAAGSGMQGLQFSGIGNLSNGDMQGIQAGGIFNVASGDLQAIALAGITNVSGGFSQGILLSGIVNVAEEFQGIGGAGVLNISNSFQGIQVSGVANIAESGQGIQIGLVNIAKEFQGLPVGLISYYGNGRKNIDAWFTDGGFTHIGLNLGTREVYNKVSAGYNPLITDRDVWTLGWSIGSYRTLDEAWNRPGLSDYFSTHDFTIQRVFDGKWSSTVNSILSYRYLPGKNIAPDLAFYAGPSFNLQVSKQDGNSDYTWYSITEGTRAGRDVRFWIGFTAGIRVFGQ